MNSQPKQEWFTAFELEGIGNLPGKATNITRRATKENWKRNKFKERKGWLMNITIHRSHQKYKRSWAFIPLKQE